MKLDQALSIAVEMKDLLSPFCERIEIAGSIRRGKPEVHDIEIVALPKADTYFDLFGTPVLSYPIQNFIPTGEQVGIWRKIKGGEKFIQLSLTNAGINLDLFLVTPPAQWGVIYLLRTGPAEFSHWCVTARRHGGAMPSDSRCLNGAVYRNRKLIPMPEEPDFFNFLELPWEDPCDRVSHWSPIRYFTRKPCAGATSRFAPTRKEFNVTGCNIEQEAPQ